ncbi:MAG: transposase [Synergistaceae bacterium]|nr:transposase [Synergistaceae bacterium]
MPKASREFTDEEKLEIIAKARQTTIAQAAKEYDVKEWIIRYWMYRTKLGKTGAVSNESESGNGAAAVDFNSFTDEEKQEILRRAEEVGFAQAAKENKITWQRLASWKKYTKVQALLNSEETQDTAAEKNKGGAEEAATAYNDNSTPSTDPAAPVKAELEALTIENVLLKDKVEALSDQLRKFRSAIVELTQISEFNGIQ